MYWGAIVICESVVCRMRFGHWIRYTLFDSGFLDYMTRLVYLIIVPDGLFVSESAVCSITFLSLSNHIEFDQIALTYPYGQFNYCT